MTPPTNIFTVDVEDYPWIFSRDFLKRQAPISERVVESTKQILDLLEKAGMSATFFCLGNVAREFPALIREIDERGFEVASHGMEHLNYTQLELGRIKSDLTEAKAILEETIGVAVRTFRAPCFGINLSRPDIFELLVEAGYESDSSIFPFAGRRYGSPQSPRGPYRIHTAAGVLTEFPWATVQVFGRRFPVAGGGYLRHFPYPISRWGIRRLNREGLPATVYLHPYECDTEQVSYSSTDLRPGAGLRAALFTYLQYRGRPRTLGKIRALINDFTFFSIAGASARGSNRNLSQINLRHRRH